jgi:mono/diheme cytochrome c family protein
MRMISSATLVAVFLVLGTVPARGADPGDPGKALYLRYCGACHGPDGKGDGVAGTFMRPKPTDLTRLAKDDKGQFPFARVMEVIDGRATVRAHGDPDMPVWGEVFARQSTWDMARQADVRGKLMVITDHIRAIQAQ